MGKLVVFLIIFPMLSWSNIRNKIAPQSGHDSIRMVEGQLLRITGSIDELERKLEDKNRKLLKNIQDKKKIEERLGQVKGFLEENKEALNYQILEVKKYFQNVLLGEVSEKDIPSTLIGKKLLTKILENKVQVLKELKFKVVQLQEELVDLQNRFEQFIQTEKDLNQLLGDLESKKKKLAENYYETQEKKEKLAIKLSKLKTQMKIKKNISKINLNEGFSTPLEEYFDVSFKNKGLTFKFKGLNQIFASKGGSVVYAGNLSTYGNVLMIDHGNNTRSVILGDMEITVKKGEQVKKGSIIGHTKGDLLKEGSLYFEVRNRDQVQNTITLMESNFYESQKNKILEEKKI